MMPSTEITETSMHGWTSRFNGVVLVYSQRWRRRRPVPQEMETWDEAECYARQMAREKKQKVLLVLNRRTSLMFSSEGELIGRRTSGVLPDPRVPPSLVTGHGEHRCRSGV